jgi:hypothetical protein
MKGSKASRPIEGGLGDDLLLGTKQNDTIYGYVGDDVIVGRRGRDLMYGGDGFDIFGFDDQDTGDVSWGLADAIGDFGAQDLIDLTDTELVSFWGFDNPDPARGTFSIWRSGANVYVTYNTYGSLHDIELTNFDGDHYSLLQQIVWYDDDYLGSAATDAEIAPGEPVQGRIEAPQDRDWFQIELEAGQLYTFNLMGQAEGGGTLPDPNLVLYDENGMVVTERFEELYYVAEADGSYFISAQSFGGTGTYTLEVTAEPYSDDFRGDITTSGRIAPGDSIAGEIKPPDDQDWLQIEVEAGQLYAFDLKGQAEGGGTLADPRLILYDPSGLYVTDRYEELYFVAETDGNYYIAATSSAQGTYTLEVTARPYVDDFGGDTNTTGQIEPGESVAGEIELPYDQDWLRIEVEAGRRYFFDLKGQADGGGTLVDPELILYDQFGNWVTSGYEELQFDAGAEGIYFIAATSWDPGTYTLEVTASASITAAPDDLLLAA